MMCWILNTVDPWFVDQVAGETEDLKCEISPLVSYDGEDVKWRVPYRQIVFFWDGEKQG